MSKYLLFTAAALCCSLYTRAQDSARHRADTLRRPADVGLNEVIVTASRNRETLGTVPSSVTILNSRQLQQQTAISTDINQVLGMTVPGLTLGSNTAANKGQTLRGRNMLIMIDGIPQSTPLRNGERDLRSIDPSVIERVEVIKGATAIYGNGADGGIINYITRKPDTTKAFRSYTEAGGGSSLVSPKNTLGGRLVQSFSGKANRFDYVVSGAYEQTGVVKDAKGEIISPFQSLGETENVNAFAKLGYNIGSKHRIEVMYNYYRTIQNSNYIDSPGVYGERPITGVPGKSPGDNQGTPYNHNAYIQYTGRDIFRNTSLNIHLYYQNFNSVFEYSDFYKPAGNSAIASRKKGARINFNTSFSFHPNLYGDVTYGADILNDVTKQSLTDGRGFVPEMNMKNYAPYAQLKTYLFKDFLLKAGLRYENITLNIPDYTTIPFGAYPGGVSVKGGRLDYSPVVFNAGLRYLKFAYFNPFISFSQSFSLYDLGRTLRLSTVADIKDIQTKAIVTNNYEAGFNSQVGALTASGSYYISTSSLGSSLKDVNGVAVPERAPERVQGFELAAAYQLLRNLSLGASYAHLEGKKTVDGKKTWLPGTRISPDKFTANISYAPLQQWDLGLYWIYSGARQHFAPRNGNYALGEGPVSSFHLLNLYTSYRFTAGTLLRIGVDNLTNTDYYPILSQAKVRQDSYIKGSGARINIALSHTF